MKMLTIRIDKSFESTLSYKAVSNKSDTNGFRLCVEEFMARNVLPFILRPVLKIVELLKLKVKTQSRIIFSTVKQTPFHLGKAHLTLIVSILTRLYAIISLTQTF
jgi:hypothetical protein